MPRWKGHEHDQHLDGWGSIPYLNVFVAVLELHGVGTFFDERLDNTIDVVNSYDSRFNYGLTQQEKLDLVESMSWAPGGVNTPMWPEGFRSYFTSHEQGERSGCKQ